MANSSRPDRKLIEGRPALVVIDMQASTFIDDSAVRAIDNMPGYTIAKCWFAKMGLVIFLTALLPHLSIQAREKQVEQKIQIAFDSGELEGLHSVIVTLKGKTLVELYFAGDDQRWGQPLPQRDHGPDELHDLRSVTKSIVSLLYGIAHSENLVPAPDQNLLQQFPEYPDLTEDRKRKAITIGDVFTMRTGLKWDESLPYSDPRNSEIAMELAPDRYRYVLEQPMTEDPGGNWSYNGGATALLARIVEKGTGKPIDVFAREKLFGPLGITNFDWVRGGDGVPSAASGLRLTLRDLAKIGELINNGGKYQSEQIIPESWLATSFEPRTQTSGGLKYGYHWYLAPQGDPPIWISGFGNGGQRLTVQPQYGLVIAVFAGNYNQPDDWKMPVRLLETYLIPGLRDRVLAK